MRRNRTARSFLQPAIGLLAACALLAALGLALSGYWKRQPPAVATNAYDVPLGVEEAVIVRYAGPRLVARPYRRGASVNVRIANEDTSGDTRVYDVRYVVSVPGEFNIIDYLAAADGSALERLPAFRVRGQTALTKDIETRIREIEIVPIRIGHWYYETLVALGGFWLLWLAGLIWIGRPRRVAPPPPAPPLPSLAEQIAAYLAALGRQELSVDDKARLERMLLLYWRERLGMADDRMAAACRRIAHDDRSAAAYRAIVGWLHDPTASVSVNEIVEKCGAINAQ